MLLVCVWGCLIINIADEIKKQTDKILRQRQLGGNAATLIVETPTGPPSVTNPNANLETHKMADDHLQYLNDERHALTDHTGLPGVGGGSFTGLTDAPASYIGQAGKVAAVNVTETGLEFITPSSGASGAFDFGSITEAASYSWDCGGIA